MGSQAGAGGVGVWSVPPAGTFSELPGTEFFLQAFGTEGKYVIVAELC